MPEVRGESTPRILVAEDHPTNQEVMRSLLRRLGYACTLAEDGAQALAAFDAEPEGFALVLMDCHMPNLDGCDATRLIREREREMGLTPVPILAVSASVFQEDRERASEAGMNGFLAKPVALGTLRTTLEAILGAGRPDDLPDEPATVADTLAARARELLIIGGPQLLADVCRIFVTEAERAAPRLDRAFRSGDPASVRDLAHRLKGTSLNVGASALADLARQLEVVARTGRLDGGEDVLRALLTELASVVDTMRAGPAPAEAR